MSATEVQPAQDAAAVTPNDTTVINARALYVGGAGSGNLTVITPRGNTVAFAGITVGYHPISAKVVKSTGTDVTNIVALF